MSEGVGVLRGQDVERAVVDYPAAFIPLGAASAPQLVAVEAGLVHKERASCGGGGGRFYTTEGDQLLQLLLFLGSVRGGVGWGSLGAAGDFRWYLFGMPRRGRGREGTCRNPGRRCPQNPGTRRRVRPPLVGWWPVVKPFDVLDNSRVIIDDCFGLLVESVGLQRRLAVVLELVHLG